MSKSTISTFQLFERFPDKESARLYFESRLWPVGPVCPGCKSAERITARKAGYYRCLACAEDFTVRTGTVMERSHIPLHKWLYAMDLLVTARKGISSMQLAKDIGVTQKSAWFLLHRLRDACGRKNLTKLRGIIEIDECFVGGLEGIDAIADVVLACFANNLLECGAHHRAAAIVRGYKAQFDAALARTEASQTRQQETGPQP
jgi:transposase-like protein